MEDATLEALRYPIGRLEIGSALSSAARIDRIDDLQQYPALVRAAVADLSDSQLDTPYRPEGWTVRQVVHHLPDSHLNSYVRFKWAVTEDDPVIRTYQEAAWAECWEARSGPVEMSLALLEALHDRWCAFLRTLTSEDWKRTFQHPEWGSVTLDANLQLYIWHGRHHLAHITGLAEREGWAAAPDS